MPDSLYLPFALWTNFDFVDFFEFDDDVESLDVPLSVLSLGLVRPLDFEFVFNFFVI